MEDSKIIELYFARSERAIDETHIKYGSFIKRLAYNILRSFEDTEEIQNDTYLGAWNSIPPVKPQVLKHYLSRIARNLSFDRLDYLNAKCRNRENEIFFEELEGCIPDRRGNAEEALELKELGESLNRFLSTLSREKCAVFLARYFYAMTIKEIAGKYGFTESKVKYILTRCRKKLKEHFANEGVII